MRKYESISCNRGEFFVRDQTVRIEVIININKVCIVTRRRRNKLQKMIEGNKKNMTILSQNIPQGTCKDRVEAYLDDIVHDLKPEILFLNEINADTIEESCPQGYRVIKGRLDNADKIRLSAIVKNNLNVEELEINMPNLVFAFS